MFQKERSSLCCRDNFLGLKDRSVKTAYGWKCRPAWWLEDATRGYSVFSFRVWHKRVKNMATTPLLLWVEIECTSLSLIPHHPQVLLLSLSVTERDLSLMQFPAICVFSCCLDLASTWCLCLGPFGFLSAPCLSL